MQSIEFAKVSGDLPEEIPEIVPEIVRAAEVVEEDTSIELQFYSNENGVGLFNPSPVSIEMVRTCQRFYLMQSKHNQK